MLTLLTSLTYKAYDCDFHNVPDNVRGLYSLYTTFKPKKSIKLFNITTEPELKTNKTFLGYVDQFRAFTLGQGYSAIPILIISLLGLVIYIIITFMCNCKCIPSRSTCPSPCNLATYVIFSILYIIAMIYYCFNIYYAEDFFTEFYRFPEIVKDSLVDLVDEWEIYNDTECELHMQKILNETTPLINRAMNSVDSIEKYFHKIPDKSWLTIRVWIYIFFALFIIFYAIQTFLYFSRGKCAICFASSYSIIVFFITLLFGALGVTVTAIATAGTEVCDNSYEITADFINQYLVETELVEIPPIALQDPDFDFGEYYNWTECMPLDENITLESLSCGTNNTMSNFCANAVPFMATYSLFIHLILITYIGFAFAIICQRTGMLKEDTLYDYEQNQPIGIGTSPRKASNNVFDHPSSDFDSSDSYQVDHNRIGYL